MITQPTAPEAPTSINDPQPNLYIAKPTADNVYDKNEEKEKKTQIQLVQKKVNYVILYIKTKNLEFDLKEVLASKEVEKTYWKVDQLYLQIKKPIFQDTVKRFFLRWSFKKDRKSKV